MPSILITGVSSGIGRACARRFADAGWQVVGTVRSEPEEPVSSGVALERLDLSVPGEAQRLAERVLAVHGCPDVLLNNAGSLAFGPLEEMGAAEIRALYQVNVFGPLELIAALLPAMRERGSGTIANVTSLGGRVVFPFFAAYNSTKWALEAISEGLWHELRPFGIRVKAIEPGFVETPIWSKALPRGEDGVRDGSPYARMMRAMLGFEAAIGERTTPDEAADQVYAAILDPADRLRYPVAAYARTLLAARRIVGDMAFMRFFHRRWMDGSR